MLIATARDAATTFALVFGAVAVIMVLARVAGRAFAMIGQPAVMGEVVAGLLLGPSVLGLIHVGGESLDMILIPPDIRPFLLVLAQLGLVVYMFVVGLELDPDAVRYERKASVSISLVSIATAFVLGATVGWFLGAADANPTQRLPIALFCGLGISGSAFAILARILEERQLFRTRIGSVLLGSAVVDDVAIWVLVGVVSFVQAASDTAGSGSAATVIKLVGFAAFTAVLFFIVRNVLFRRTVEGGTDDAELAPTRLAVLLSGLMLSAVATSVLLGSPILGAFMFGAAVPRARVGPLIGQLTRSLAPVATVVLLPIFFVTTGLEVDISALGAGGFAMFALFLLAATVGKIGGAATAAFASGFRGRRAFAIGTLMNTRGLTELAILNLGLTTGLLPRNLFTVLVCTAIAATLLSAPLLNLIYPARLVERDIATVERDRQVESDTYRVLLVMPEEADEGPSLEMAEWLTGLEEHAELVLALVGQAQATGNDRERFVGEVNRLSSQLERLRQVSERASRPGLAVIPQALMSSDAIRELLSLVERMEPMVIVVPRADNSETAELVDLLVDQRIADVVCLRESESPTETCVINFGRDRDSGLAAAEIGVRIAFSTHRWLDLPDDRAYQRFRGAANRAGIRLTADGGPSVVVAASNPAVLPTGMAFGRPDAHRDRLAEHLGEALEQAVLSGRARNPSR